MNAIASAFQSSNHSGNAYGHSQFRSYSQPSTITTETNLILSRAASVSQTYYLNHTKQTFNFVTSMHEKYTNTHPGKKEVSIWQAIQLLDQICDDSDPDTELPQIQHLLQTAEALKASYPEEDKEWLPLVGLIHDLGKVLAHPEFDCQPQWAVVGDTFPVGCQFDTSSIVHPEFFTDNPDSSHPIYSTKLGIYKQNCGLDQVLMSWGHDEYLYQVLTQNPRCIIPPEGLAIIRYHSFYALHQQGAYGYLLNERDREVNVPYLKMFQKFDLYSKTAEKVDVEAVTPYYRGLIEKYLPGTFKW